MVERLSPGMVIALFVLPFVPLIPLLKLAEFWLLAHHHYVWAAVLIVGGKVVGAAFSTRIFAVARPKMLQVRWFASAHGYVIGLLARGHAVLDGIPAWVNTRAVMRRMMARLRARGRWARRWAAARRLVRRRAG